jgi:hypothetical protein
LDISHIARRWKNGRISFTHALYKGCPLWIGTGPLISDQLQRDYVAPPCTQFGTVQSWVFCETMHWEQLLKVSAQNNCCATERLIAISNVAQKAIHSIDGPSVGHGYLVPNPALNAAQPLFVSSRCAAHSLFVDMNRNFERAVSGSGVAQQRCCQSRGRARYSPVAALLTCRKNLVDNVCFSSASRR